MKKSYFCRKTRAKTILKKPESWQTIEPVDFAAKPSKIAAQQPVAGGWPPGRRSASS